MLELAALAREAAAQVVRTEIMRALLLPMATPVKAAEAATETVMVTAAAKVTKAAMAAMKVTMERAEAAEKVVEMAGEVVAAGAMRAAV